MTKSYRSAGLLAKLAKRRRVETELMYLTQNSITVLQDINAASRFLSQVSCVPTLTS